MLDQGNMTFKKINFIKDNRIYNILLEQQNKKKLIIVTKIQALDHMILKVLLIRLFINAKLENHKDLLYYKMMEIQV